MQKKSMEILILMPIKKIIPTCLWLLVIIWRIMINQFVIYVILNKNACKLWKSIWTRNIQMAKRNVVTIVNTKPQLGITWGQSSLNICVSVSTFILKTGYLKKRQKYIKISIMKMFKKWFIFFPCILPDYLAHDITKEFWKNSHFENMTDGFLLRCQNSLR